MNDPGLILVLVFGVLGLICLIVIPPFAPYPFGLAGLVFAAWLLRRMS